MRRPTSIGRAASSRLSEPRRSRGREPWEGARCAGTKEGEVVVAFAEDEIDDQWIGRSPASVALIASPTRNGTTPSATASGRPTTSACASHATPNT